MQGFFMSDIYLVMSLPKNVQIFLPIYKTPLWIFFTLVEQHGFYKTNFHQYIGKISPSWRNLNPTDPAYIHTCTHKLWHYHIGIPVIDLAKHRIITHQTWSCASFEIDIRTI